MSGIAKKNKILVLVDWYLPGYRAGGPIRSCANLIALLKNEFDFSVLTTDTDWNADKPYETISANQWTRSEDGTRVYYISSSLLTRKKMKELVLSEGFDVVYMNSMFSGLFTIYPLQILNRYRRSAKVVIAPRGMLGQGALNIKPFKKKVFLFYAKLTGLFKNVTWHASTENEKQEIEQVFGLKSNIVVALNVPSALNVQKVKRTKQNGHLHLVFFSRISPKKNLHRIIDALAMLPDDLVVALDVYGTEEDPAYALQCKQLAASLSASKKITFKGVLPPRSLQDVLVDYHFSVLLTAHENYGHSIAESFFAGMPVIISDQTPWQGLERMRCGWDIPLADKEKLMSALLYAARMDQPEFDRWSDAAYEMGQRILKNPALMQQNQKLFLK